MTKRKLLTGIGTVAVVAAVAVGVLAAVSSATPPGSSSWQYLAKFVCGVQPAEGFNEHVKPGNYATAINVGNHTVTDRSGEFKVLIAARIGAPPPPVVANVPFLARKLRTTEIDCPVIWAAAGVPPGTFLKGFVHIGLPVDFPVTAVYTSQTNNVPPGAPDAGAGISIDVEQIAPWGRAPIG